MLGSDFLFWSALRAMPDTLVRTLLATDPALLDTASLAERARVREILWSILPVADSVEGLLNDARLAGDPPSMAIGDIASPTLAISLEDDLFLTADAARHIAASVPGARLIIYPKSGHVWVSHESTFSATPGRPGLTGGSILTGGPTTSKGACVRADLTAYTVTGMLHDRQNGHLPVMSRTSRAFAMQTVEALRLFGALVRLARRERRMTESELAERAGIARSTLQKIERGDPGVNIGLAFEAASMAGVALFEADATDDLGERRARVADRLALLPRTVRQHSRKFDDDF